MSTSLLALDQWPPPPAMPTRSSQRRSIHQAARLSILDEDFDDLQADWNAQYVSDEVLEGWGPSDTSTNPLSSYARQLSTPGRYGHPPTVEHAVDPLAADGLIGAHGQLARAGWLTKMSTVEYLTLGVGEHFVRLDVHRGDLTLRLVPACTVHLIANVDRPDEIEQLWELRARTAPPAIKGGEPRRLWTWDVYDLGDELVGRPPSFRIYEADHRGAPVDASDIWLIQPGDVRGALVGDAYPYRFADTGRAYLPWVRYRSADNGKLWNWKQLRGLHRGTLMSSMYATYTGRSALDATGSHALAWGLDPAVSTRHGEQSSYAAPVRSMAIRPGTINFCDVADDVGQPGVVQIGPGVNLEPLSEFTARYIHRLHAQRGLSGADVQKQAANPTSGAALYISDKQRREFADMAEPIFRRFDLELLRKAAALLNAETGSAYPLSGYSIVYFRLPPSPQEAKDGREAQEWEVSQGYKSKVDIYRERNPGTSREDAIAALARIVADEAELRSVAELLTKEPTNADELPAL
tara:strand:+ start:975 stop:2540 length:1566 start_codon:yes stop_codon:yes gene_type:complete